MKAFVIILAMLCGQALGADELYTPAIEMETAEPCAFNEIGTGAGYPERDSVENRADWPSMPSGYL